MRFIRLFSATLLVGALVAGSAAAAADFGGAWSVSSTMIAHGQVVGTATPICKFVQSGYQLSGMCRGPNARGPASGSVNGLSIAWQWFTTATTPNGLNGVQSFRGTLGADGVIRGLSRSSNFPGLRGAFTAQRPY